MKKNSNLSGRTDVLLLAVESSCDETSVAVLRGNKLLSLVTGTQIPIHRRFGGVVPEVASRNHTLAINAVAEEALSKAGVGFADLEAVAVTYGAGLAGALLVGVSYAKALAFALQIPLYGVNHIRGHIAANYLAYPDLQPPYVCLVVSGGHTAIVEIDSYLTHRLIGSTVDDAVGEAFDKVARCLNLPYPGGPEIDRLAQKGSPTIAFPRMCKDEKDGVRFSYSGIKTFAINYLHNLEQKGESVAVEDFCASFTCAAIDVPVEKTVWAAKTRGLSKIAVAGGVSANSYLRNKLQQEGKKAGLSVYIPPMTYCTDNAAMIGMEAQILIREGVSPSPLSLNAQPALRFENGEKA